MTRFWKRYKKRLVFLALVAGLYNVASPDIEEFDDKSTYEPNSIQQEFMRLAAQKYDYVALGDTDHRLGTIRLFTLSSKFLSAVSKGGDKNFFLETAPSKQKYFDALKSGTLKSYDQAGDNMWLCNDEMKTRINSNFSESARHNKDIRFIAADERHTKSSALNNSVFFDIFAAVPLTLYSMIYGCVDTPAFIPLMIMSSIVGNDDEIMANIISDDRPTAKFIMSHKDGGTIFYGAAHFEDNDKEEDKYKMRHLLREAGKSVILINIYADKHQRDDSIAKDVEADVYFYVTPSSDNLAGIYINNPELQELYNKAKEHLQKQKLRPSVQALIPSV